MKEAAKRRGTSEAEIIRQGIHLAAMANRVRDESLFPRTFEGSGHSGPVPGQHRRPRTKVPSRMHARVVAVHGGPYGLNCRFQRSEALSGGLKPG